jgi:AcrR family transcriptional regulator
MSSARSTEVAQRAGRPRDEDRTRAILDATVQELVDAGYAAMTVDAVAARSGTSKATIYRRWSTKAELVAEAVETHAFAELPIEDTGDVRADLLRYLTALERALSGLDGDLLVALTIEKLRNPDLAAAFTDNFVTARRTRLLQLLRNAVARGDLRPDTDVELLADVGPALFHHAVVKGQRRRGLAERIVAQFVGPAPGAS